MPPQHAPAVLVIGFTGLVLLADRVDTPADSAIAATAPVPAVTNQVSMAPYGRRRKTSCGNRTMP